MRETTLGRLSKRVALGVTALVAVGLGSSCDTFTGSVVTMAITYPVMLLLPDRIPSPPAPAPIDLHLEMWAKLSDGSYKRLAADIGDRDPSDSTIENGFTGFSVARAIDPNDPCLIRGLDRDDPVCKDGVSASDPAVCGAQLFSKRAQAVTDESMRDLAQTALVLQARKVTDPSVTFNAVFPTCATMPMPDPTCRGRAPSPLLVLTEYNPRFTSDPRKSGALPATTTTNADDSAVSQNRLAQCANYRDSNPNFYVGNPRQYTKPLAGRIFGFFSFSTMPSATMPDLPVQSFGGVTFSVRENLSDIVEMYISAETYPPPAVPTPTRLMFYGVKRPEDTGGRGVVRMAVLVNTAFNPLVPAAPMFSTTVGTAAIATNLDQGLH